MRKYVQTQVSTLLRRFAFQVNRASRSVKAEDIHDLRVAIQRLSQCLLVFEQFFARAEVKTIRKELREFMELAGDVRNRDVALELLKKAGIADEGGAAEERKLAKQKLLLALRQWARHDTSRRWRVHLNG